jgi:hypothetical protein
MQTWPEDLIRLVVDAIVPHDRDALAAELAALKTCMRVNKAFYLAALPHMFRNVSVQRQRRCHGLLELLSRHGELKTYIRKVTISQVSRRMRCPPGTRAPNRRTNFGWTSLASIQQLLQMLPNLQMLHICDISLGRLQVADLTSSRCVLRAPYLRMDNCSQLTLHGLARLLDYMTPSRLQLDFTMDSDDKLPPSWLHELPEDWTKTPGLLNEFQFHVQSSNGRVAMPKWFITQGYARSVSKLTLFPEEETFRAAWAIVKQAAGTLEQLNIHLPHGAPNSLSPIVAPHLTLLRLYGITDSTLSTAVLIVEQCLGPHSARLGELVIEATLKGTIVAQSPNLSPWTRLDWSIASTARPDVKTARSVLIHVTQPTTRMLLVNPADGVIRSCMPFTHSHRHLVIETSWSKQSHNTLAFLGL